MQVPYRKPGKFNHLAPDPLITQKKHDELSNELYTLKESTRPRAMSEVSRLAELGDFSENVEYQLAKGRLRGINHRIAVIEKQLINAVILPTPTNTEVVDVGHRVTISDGTHSKTYQLLGSTEIKPKEGVISHHSPLGKALIGHRLGDTVEIQLPQKRISYRITHIA